MRSRHAPIITDIRNKQLLIEGKEVSFPEQGGKAFQHADYGDLHIVVFYPGDLPNPQNVQAYDAHGRLLWKAESRAPGNYDGDNFYLYISYENDGKTYLITYSEAVVELNLENGKVTLLFQDANGEWKPKTDIAK